MSWGNRTGATLLLGLVIATSAEGDAVDDYVQSQMRARHIPGVSLAIIRDGKIIKANGYGAANLELNVPATTATVFEIGSNTKQFTGAALMILVEEGRIQLDDKITKYFPDAPETWNGMTIRHLLTHTSGIQNHVAVPGYMNIYKTSITSETTPTRDELLRMFFKLPLEFQPGETWAYDNTGYILLGIIIEKASGKTYWHFLDERIFKPLGMAATRNTEPTPLVPNRASGYEWVKDHFENRPILAPFVAFSAGSILSTVEDMAKWDAALYTEKILKSSGLDQVWTAAKTKDGADASTGKGFWKWFASHGTLESFTFSDAEESGNGRIVRYQATLGGNRYWLSCKLSQDGKIAQIHWW